MSHTPPIPDAAVSPYPATPAPHDKAPAPAPAGKSEEPRTAKGMDKRVVAGVAGIAVGSAAIAAALLFAGRNSKPKSAATAPAKPTGAPQAHRPEAVD